MKADGEPRAPHPSTLCLRECQVDATAGAHLNVEMQRKFVASWAKTVTLLLRAVEGIGYGGDDPKWAVALGASSPLAPR